MTPSIHTTTSTTMTFHQPSGITQGLSLFIDANWTPAQAWAVIELLDDLRERLHAHYQLALAAWLAEDRQVHPDGRDDDLHYNDFRSNHKGPAGPLVPSALPLRLRIRTARA